jgi:hypothetical protein
MNRSTSNGRVGGGGGNGGKKTRKQVKEPRPIMSEKPGKPGDQRPEVERVDFRRKIIYGLLCCFCLLAANNHGGAGESA